MIPANAGLGVTVNGGWPQSITAEMRAKGWGVQANRDSVRDLLRSTIAKRVDESNNLVFVVMIEFQ